MTDLILEVGKTYRNKRGNKVTTTSLVNNQTSLGQRLIESGYAYSGDDGWTYKEDGTHINDGQSLVEETRDDNLVNNIVLTSQVIGSPDFHLHGIFPSFDAAAKHLIKDSNLSENESLIVTNNWRQGGAPGDTHRSYICTEASHDNFTKTETYWVASIQPIRNKIGL